MSEDYFEIKKSQLLQTLKSQLITGMLSETELTDIKILSRILNEYTYAKRLLNKGTLSRVITDSIKLNNNFLEPFLWFDKSIS